MDEKKWRLINLIWWPVETEFLAKRAVFVCFVITCYYALTWTVSTVIEFPSPVQFGIWNIMTNLLPAITYPAIAILIAWGLFRMNRTAAIAGSIISLVNAISPIYKMITGSLVHSWEISIAIRFAILSFLYLQGIRGAISYRRLNPGNTASVISEP